MSLTFTTPVHPTPARQRARTVLAAVILSSILLLVVSPPAQAFPFAHELRSWAADATGTTTEYLKLEEGEEFDTYVFRLHPADEVEVTVGVVEVKNLYGDLVCRGVVSYHFGLLSVVRQCPDLRIEHRYVMTWTADRPGTQLRLMGY